jgi:pimeloyl-ACP methyl ester carboxylesterase
VEWWQTTLWIAGGLVVTVLLAATLWVISLLRRYLGVIIRIFEEKPLFIVPRGQPIAGSEQVRFRTRDDLELAGCYLRTPSPQRRGVILFCPEFGSNRWACGAYCERLLAHGFDIFSFEFRNQGESDALAGYEPMQWVTEFERRDVEAAVKYLRQRPDAEPNGIGLFGISRGGGAGILVTAEDQWIRCLATDGAFSTRTTMVPYMKKWIAIYAHRPWLAAVVPTWLYQLAANLALRRVGRKRGCTFPSLLGPIRRIAPRPLFMIHGEADTYIKPEIARELFESAREPRTFWLVDGAKHNQALHVAGEEYHQRLVDFFTQHLSPTLEPEPAEQLAPVG